MIKPRADHSMKGKEILICAICGKEFIRKAGRQRYCGPKCNAKSNKIAVDLYNKSKKLLKSK